MKGTVLRRARKMPTEFVLCHAWGHAWEEDLFPSNLRPPQWGYRESVRCGRCTSERHFTIDSMGRVSSRYYRYVDGYQVGVRTNRSEWRQEMRKAAFIDPKLRARREVVPKVKRRRTAAA
jgi:hypothetical protein